MARLNLSLAIATISLVAFSLVPNTNACVDDGWRKFVGFSQTKAFFAIPAQGDWEYVTDYCHMYKMQAASIETHEENEIITNYLNSSTQFDSFWLPATDYITEGTFAWIQTKKPFAYSNWAAGSPSISRTKNCVAIQKDGRWTEEQCVGSVYRTGLCELPLLNQYPETESRAVQSDHALTVPVARQGPRAQIPTAEQAKAARIEPIGGVGSKLYYKDETLTPRKMHQSLEFCHVLGMRLVSPETPEEFEFLGNYSRQLAQEGERDPIILTSGTDMLSSGCNQGNAMYRWFYSEDPVHLEGEQLVRHWWYKCIYINPSSFTVTDCIGMLLWTLCELDTGN